MELDSSIGILILLVLTVFGVLAIIGRCAGMSDPSAPTSGLKARDLSGIAEFIMLPFTAVKRVATCLSTLFDEEEVPVLQTRGGGKSVDSVIDMHSASPPKKGTASKSTKSDASGSSSASYASGGKVRIEQTGPKSPLIQERKNGRAPPRSRTLSIDRKAPKDLRARDASPNMSNDGLYRETSVTQERKKAAKKADKPWAKK